VTTLSSTGAYAAGGGAGSRVLYSFPGITSGQVGTYTVSSAGGAGARPTAAAARAGPRQPSFGIAALRSLLLVVVVVRGSMLDRPYRFQRAARRRRIKRHRECTGAPGECGVRLSARRPRRQWRIYILGEGGLGGSGSTYTSGGAATGYGAAAEVQLRPATAAHMRVELVHPESLLFMSTQQVQRVPPVRQELRERPD